MSATATAGFHNLETMVAYMDGQCAKITALVKEIGEVQQEFEGHFVQSQQQFENARAAAAAWVEAGGWKSPAWLIEALDRRLPEARQACEQRLQELQKQLQDLADQQARIEGENDKAMALVKERNPLLNAREEKLKAEEAAAQEKAEKLHEKWRRAAAGLGWLLRPGAVRRAREAMIEADAEWVNINGRLGEVRNSWVALQDKTTQVETDLQAAWRLRVAETARLRRELGLLQRDPEGAARERALDDILDSVADAKRSDQPEFDALLSAVVTAHDACSAYEAGIAQVAELMGMTRGVCEGLTRMGESVKSVKAEQDMHSELARLKLQAPSGVVAFHGLWDVLQPLVLDEKQAAQHPAEFASALKQAIGPRLSNEAIEAMFAALGNELNRATKEQWG